MLDKIKGIIPPIITPLKNDENIDEKGLQVIVDFLIDHGVAGIFALGTAGEFPYIPLKKRIQVIKIIKDQLKSTCFLLMGISDLSLKNILLLLNEGLDLDVDGFVITFPQYFSLSSDEIRLILKKIHENARGKPILAYDVSSVVPTTAHLPPRLIIELAKERIIQGLKYTGADWEHHVKIILEGIEDRNTFKFLAGTERIAHAFYEHEIPLDGGIFSASNLFPRLYHDFFEALKTKNEVGLSRTLPLISSTGGIFGTVPSSAGPNLIKQILIKLGAPITDNVHSPLPRIKSRVFKKIDKLLAQIDSEGYLDRF
ncbi:MAG: dihydrodipicolinate synthase family protein [Promethearchaeota archaeon]